MRPSSPSPACFPRHPLPTLLNPTAPDRSALPLPRSLSPPPPPPPPPPHAHPRHALSPQPPRRPLLSLRAPQAQRAFAPFLSPSLPSSLHTAHSSTPPSSSSDATASAQVGEGGEEEGPQ
eukprot:2242136-Rhodomonas_salina.1